MKKVLLSAMAALSLVACQESFSDKNTVGEGKIAITASVTGEVTTRVETGVDIPTPALSEFSLLIQGTDANTSLTEPRSWESLSAYNYEDERFLAGFYDVTVACGDATAEGYTAPYFTATKNVQVLDRNKTTNVELVATVGNAVVLVQTTDAFNGFFPVSNFTVTTQAGNVIEVNKEATDHLFVAANQSITIDCECIRQSNIATAKVESLASQSINTLAATRYVVTYDLSTAGGITIEITLNDSVLDSTPVNTDTELNPNA